MKLGLAFGFVLREMRGGLWRATFFALCIGIGVTAVVAVASLADTIEGGLRSQSKELLAADFAVRARRPLPPELDEWLARELPGHARADVREMATMVGRAVGEDGVEGSTLCELKIVTAGYPFYGSLELEPARDLGELLTEDAVVVSPDLVSGLKLAIGDEVRVGGARFRVAGLVHSEGDRLDFSLTLGPRVILSQAGFERTDLDLVGNRVRYKALVRTPSDLGESALGALGRRLMDALPDSSYLRFESHFEAQPGVRRGLERFRSYLGLVALLSLLLGGIGVAQIVRTWLRSRITSIAVWKSLGASGREILGLHAAHVLALALLGCAFGALLGSWLPRLLAWFAPDLIPGEAVGGLQHAAVARGFALGIGIALLFSLPALGTLRRIPPAAVLRQLEVPAPPWRTRIALTLVLIAGVLVTSVVQSGSWRVGGAFTLGVGVFAAALWGSARLLVWLAKRVPKERVPARLAHALAALARPASGTVGGIVALGLGTLVVSAMLMIQRRLGEALRGALPEEAPSVFLVDVQVDQWPDLRERLESAGAEAIEAVPVSMARLASIDGVPVRELLERRSTDGARGQRWGLTREQRLTFWDELPASNRLVAGELWARPDLLEASLEEDYAEDIGAQLGSRVTFDLQGVPIEVVVTSLRRVEWESFQINFFVALEPGVLDGAPQVRLAAARLAPEGEAELQDELVAAFPNVTMLRVRPILERVGELLDRIALGVQILGAFTILTGLMILMGAIVASRLGRAREVALMKTYGLHRAAIVRLFAAEFALTGAVAGLLGAVGAAALSWAFLEQVVDLEARLPMRLLVGSIVATVVVSVVAGLVASRRALVVAPVETLRMRDEG